MKKKHSKAAGENRSAPSRKRRDLVPHWDSKAGKLWVGGMLVKHFKVPASSQRPILDAFQELDWPRRMDDPMPRLPGRDPKERLHQAIEGLNGRQINRLIGFHGDGTGRGLYWEIIADRSHTDRL